MSHAILIVDDEAEVLESLRRTLRKEGYQIVTTTLPARALELIEEGGVDLLISDIDMPDISGLELVARVRREHPEVVRMLLTGGASLASAIKAINEGEVHRYLTKPWDKQSLRDTVREATTRIDELRRAAAAGRASEGGARLRARLERQHPGILEVERGEEDHAYLLRPQHLDNLAARLASPWLRAFFR